MNAFYFVADEGLADIVSAQSFHLAHLWDCDVHIFIERRNKDSFVREVQHNKRIYYHYDELMASLPSGLPVSERWPHIVYLRLFAPNFLTKYNRVLYLDADIHGIRQAKEIWSIEIPHGIGAVSDYALIHNGCRDYFDSVGVYSGKYFNSGVLLIDIKKWDTSDIPSKLCSYFNRYPNSPCFDQDFLNATLEGYWTELGPKFNYQAPLLNIGLSKAIAPVFVHFNSEEKPWYGWLSDGATTIDSQFIKLYKALLENAGFSPSLYKRPESVSLFKKYKAFSRRVQSRWGMPSRKEKEALLKYQERRSSILKYIQEQRNQVAINTSDFDYTFFDGRYVRSQFHFADYNSLTG